MSKIIVKYKSPSSLKPLNKMEGEMREEMSNLVTTLWQRTSSFICVWFCNIFKISPLDLTFRTKSKIPRITGSQVCKWQSRTTSKSKWNCFAFHWQKEKNNLTFHLIYTEHQSFYPGSRENGLGCSILPKCLGVWCEAFVFWLFL